LSWTDISLAPGPSSPEPPAAARASTPMPACSAEPGARRRHGHRGARAGGATGAVRWSRRAGAGHRSSGAVTIAIARSGERPVRAALAQGLAASIRDSTKYSSGPTAARSGSNQADAQPLGCRTNPGDLCRHRTHGKAYHALSASRIRGAPSRRGGGSRLRQASERGPSRTPRDFLAAVRGQAVSTMPSGAARATSAVSMQKR